MRKARGRFVSLPFIFTWVLFLTEARALVPLPSQDQKVEDAIKQWDELGLRDYIYTVTVGGVFGAGKYRVEVRDDKCVSRHVGGIGMGKSRFLDRFRAEPTCDGRLIEGLMKNVRDDIARGYSLDEDIRVDAEYGYLKSAHLDTSELFDQGWGFEITQFKILTVSHSRRPKITP